MKSHSIQIAAINFCFLFMCGVKTVFSIDLLAPKIIGGQDANPGQFPYAVGIYAQSRYGIHFCGGALLNNQWVLTSGHCVYDGILFRIQLGSNYLTANDSNRVTLASSEFLTHPDFNPAVVDNEIGLIKLRLPVDLTDYIQPIELPTSSLPDYDTVTLLGWGQTSDTNSNFSEKLQYVSVITITNHECTIIYGGQIFPNMGCVQGNYNEGICVGDGGGPLVQNVERNSQIVGVASFHSGHGCENSDPSGFTRIFPYVDWIKDQISG